MRWFGIILALAGLVAALVAWFSFQNLPFLIGGSVCVLIGLIIFGYGTRALPKRTSFFDTRIKNLRK